MKDCGMPALEDVTKDYSDSLLPWIDGSCKEASIRLDDQRRAQMGQFLTPSSVATFMADMLQCANPIVRVLDPGAGVGSLSAAFVVAMCRRPHPPTTIKLTAYEIDPLLVSYLHETLDRCRAVCEKTGIQFEARVVMDDFLGAGASALSGDLFITGEKERFNCAILNPPYRKIHTESRERKLLRSIGLETTNLYAGFLAVTARLLAPGGEMVAITPRSFCNGSYFEPFRRFFLREMRFRRIHVFEARDRAFSDNDVLQENVVFRAVRTTDEADDVVVSSSLDHADSNQRVRTVKHDDAVRPGDPHAFIHIVPGTEGDLVRSRIGSFAAKWASLGLTISTGRVVDFRAKELLRAQPGRNTVPLIYPCHLRDGFVQWPSGHTRKPNALALGPRAQDLILPAGYYVLVKRFSTKEERRRVVAAVYDPSRIPAERVAFENHVNYYHVSGAGLPANLAKGLAAFLNSTLVDSYFRHFSGHTQVNAMDLRSLRYPSRDKLVALGRCIGKSFPSQEELDRLLDKVVFHG